MLGHLDMSLNDHLISGTFTEEVFRVTDTLTKYTIPLVYVTDLTGVKIRGGLYPEEVQLIRWHGQRKVKKILKRRKLKGRQEYLVTLDGFPVAFSEWVTTQRPRPL